MPQISLLVWINDKDDLPSGHKQIKRGDIADVKPYPYQGGVVERKMILIINLEVPTKIAQKARRLMATHYSTTILEVDLLNASVSPATIGKRRFHLPWQKILDKVNEVGWPVNWSRVANPDDNYQPFESRVFPLSKFTDFVFDKSLNQFINEDGLDG